MKNSSIKQPITLLMLVICIFVYVFTIFKYGTSEEARVILEMGGKFNPLIIENQEWWRLLSAGFIHIGFTHLLMNGISLYYLGSELEMAIGSLRFLIVYIVAILGGNFLSFAFNIEHISAGASTGVFGLFAAIIALSLLYPESSLLKQRANSFLFLIVFNVITGIITPGLDNLGHIGGAVFGLLMMLCLGTQQKKLKVQHRLLIFILIIGLFFSLFYLGVANYQAVIGGMMND